tara:strand:- start:688 stop:1032 length:345 start_codon:yes stop_codon:yes gene_type:complete
MQDYSNIALSVSNAIRTSIQGDNKVSLGDRELQVLEHVTPEHSHGRCVFMEDGMSLKYLGSRYTLRKSIQKLIDLDSLNIDTTDDSRQRSVVPAVRALALFDTIGKSISHTLAA